MQNELKDRFLALLKGAETKVTKMLSKPLALEEWLDVYADHLIENNATLLPCKVGDTIYVVFSQFKSDIMECKVDELSVQKDGVYVIVDLHYPNYVAYRNTAIPEWWFGRYAFFSKEEAEQKIQEMRGNDG